jgi:hypothetical protein
MTVKKPAKKAVKKAVKKTAHPAPKAMKSNAALVDKAIDLIKWVDSPFKLLAVILLGVFGLSGWLVYENKDKIANKVLVSEAMPVMVGDDKIVSVSQALIRDLRAETVIVHEINLSSNARTTRVALSAEGRYAPLEGKKGAFFSGSPARNHAAVSMLNGEVLCETFEASSDVGDWIISKGVTYACRGSIPPEQGSMVGYLSVGFKGPQRDVTAVKARINQATKELAK